MADLCTERESRATGSEKSRHSLGSEENTFRCVHSRASEGGASLGGAENGRRGKEGVEGIAHGGK